MSSFSRSKRLSFTTTLRRPIASMISRAWRSAPAPIESMAMTAPTPKMIPSMARKERSAWWRRLERPEASASRGSITGPPPPAAESAGPRARFSVGSRSAITSPAARPESSTTREMLCRPIAISTGRKPPPSRR